MANRSSSSRCPYRSIPCKVFARSRPPPDRNKIGLKAQLSSSWLQSLVEYISLAIRSFTHHVARRFIVLFTDILSDVVFRQEMNFARDGPGFGVGFRIVDRELNVHMSYITARETLGQMHRFGLGMASHIQPFFAVEARGFNHQRIAFPMPNRVTLPRGIRIHRQRPSVHEDL